jgi:DNA-binding NarL/FixJ family response regulator
MFMRPSPPGNHVKNRLNMAAETIRTAIVEDDRLAREGLRLLIDGTPGFQCVGAYGSAEEGLHSLRGTPADVLLLDIQLPGMEGTEAVEIFADRFPKTAIIMLTLYDDEERVFTALCRGARGYLLKKTPPARLLEAVREARDGGAPLSPEIAHKVVRLFRDLRPPTKAEHDLTYQEVRLLALLADGHSYQTAAAELKVSINTVRNYIRSIYDKLHVHSKSEAVSKALKAGII